MKPPPSLVSALRLTSGFALAPTVGAAAYMLLLSEGRRIDIPNKDLVDLFGLVATVAFVQAVLIGLPTYFILRGRVRPTLLNAVAVGVVIAIAPWLVYAATLSHPIGSEGIKSLICITLSGLPAGLMFWMCVAWRSPQFDPKVIG